MRDPDPRSQQAGNSPAENASSPPGADEAQDTLVGNIPAPTQAPGTGAGAPLLPSGSIPGYTLLAKIGEGGMGIVFRAQQHEPRRLVALKIVRGGPVADDLSVQMFRREADMLARLKHPEIAAVYELGRSEGGQHYLAMELVPGPTLDVWLESERASGRNSREDLRRRLRMFAGICDTVQHAHQRGVIHRDLKPSNLIVMEEKTGADPGEAPRVKVLDFGLARIVDAENEGHTIISREGGIKGTLPYMSPEQARGDLQAVDVRSDVYALGVILYEMLTGKRPYEVSGESLMAALTAICEAPPRSLAAAWPSGSKPDSDLETIVAKALAKDPELRYGSAAALAEDVGRYLGSQPIMARAPSTFYQIRKLMARRKGPFAAAAAGLVLIVAAAVGMGALYLRSERNLARALSAEQSARQETRTAQSTADFLVDLFGSVDPARARGREITAREILDEGAREIERGLNEEPVTRARLMSTMGEVYRKLGCFQEAHALVGKALALRREHLGPEHADVAVSLNDLGRLKLNLGDRAGSEEAYRAAIAIFERGDTLKASGLPSALGNLGWFLGDDERFDEAHRVIDRALSLVRQQGGMEDPRLIDLLSNLSTIEMDSGDPHGAIADLDSALTLSRRIHGELHPQTANILTNLGIAHSLRGDFERALDYGRQALALRERIYGEEHFLVLEAVANVGIGLAQLGRLMEARPYFERALSLQEKLYGRNHPDVARAQLNLGKLDLDMGRPKEALPHLEQAIAIRHKAYGPDHPSLALPLFVLGECRLALHEPRAARDLLLKALALDEKALGENHPDIADDLDALARTLRALGDEDAARRHEQRAARIRARAPEAGETS